MSAKALAKLLTVREVAAYLQVTEARVYQMVREGMPPRRCEARATGENNTRNYSSSFAMPAELLCPAAGSVRQSETLLDSKEIKKSAN